jgi:hypothetical protein
MHYQYGGYYEIRGKSLLLKKKERVPLLPSTFVVLFVVSWYSLSSRAYLGRATWAAPTRTTQTGRRSPDYSKKKIIARSVLPPVVVAKHASAAMSLPRCRARSESSASSSCCCGLPRHGARRRHGSSLRARSESSASASSYCGLPQIQRPTWADP